MKFGIKFTCSTLTGGLNCRNFMLQENMQFQATFSLWKHLSQIPGQSKPSYATNSALSEANGVLSSLIWTVKVLHCSTSL